MKYGAANLISKAFSNTEVKMSDRPGGVDSNYTSLKTSIPQGVQWYSKFNAFSNPDGMTYNLTQ